MKTLITVLRWVLSIVLLLPAILSAVDGQLMAIPFLGLILLVMPPVDKVVALSPKVRASGLLVMFIGLGVTAGIDADMAAKERAEQQAAAEAAEAAREKQAAIDYFNANSEQILADANAAMESGDHAAVVDLTKHHLAAGNEQIRSLHSQASAVLEKGRAAKKTEKLLAELKTIPADQFEANRSRYQQLVNMHPANDGYRAKLAHYNQKVAEQEQKAREAAKRKELIKQQFSAWDGSHYKLERVIKKAMNDPDSYDHDETVYWDRGDHLVVMTTFRGKNAFGGVVKNSVKARVAIDGQVLEILDQY